MAAGRKPVPAELIDNEKRKISNEELAEREDIESKLRTRADLKCPAYLTPDAKKEWKRIMKLYREMALSILNDLDVMALVMYCEATAVYKKAHETWARAQQVVTGNEKTQHVLDKTRKIMNEQIKVINMLSEQLCLTPIGRARMGAASIKKPESNPIHKLVNEED